MAVLHIPGDTDDVSDGFHTFGDLYEHRIALYLALLRELGTGWRSRLHADGSAFEGWFLVGVTLPTGAITYHLPERDWEETAWLTTLERAPAWDGHTADDVVVRLRLYAYLEKGS